MQDRTFETLIGAIICAIALIFGAYAYKSTDLGGSSEPSYTLSAKFERIDGLKTGADVRISGVKVGSVISSTISKDEFLANVTFTLRKDIAIPDDSSAEIHSDGLLGGKFLQIVPGGSTTTIPPHGQITITQSSVSLEELISGMMYGKKE
ncbi:MAG: outer membrane lipid asymmetry maintenance protein MlaD [Alphaproteobacteria bacterium]|nr:MAG: outer membrane lipid asymmetry maintenance protein MlaD [Alphaproteobacteria bacterium]